MQTELCITVPVTRLLARQ